MVSHFTKGLHTLRPLGFPLASPGEESEEKEKVEVVRPGGNIGPELNPEGLLEELSCGVGKGRNAKAAKSTPG